MEKVLELLGDIVQCFGVQMRTFGEPFSGLENYDGGLRSLLFKKHDTWHLEKLLLSMVRNDIYMVEDTYNCHYFFLRLNESGNDKFCIAGPWIEIPPASNNIEELVQRNSIPPRLKTELEHYFNNLPFISSHMCWEAMLITVAEHICEGGKISVSYQKLESCGETENEYNPEQESVLPVRVIEELYKNEDALLDAVRNGNAGEALKCVAHFSYYRVPERVSDKFRNSKNYVLILNTLFRKAVQSSYVHPLHIHTMSGDFAKRIEAATKPSELIYLEDSMVRNYCALVQKHSFGKYSLVVRKVLTTVQFNLREQHSLSALAEQVHIHPSKLSHRFKQEMGVTLTDYINFRRLEMAKSLLSGSGLYIQEIAEQCGFLDTNYFTRLFKRNFGISPRVYRERNM